MSSQTIVFSLNAAQTRVVPSAIFASQSSSNPGALAAAGGTAVGTDGITYTVDNNFGRKLQVGSGTVATPVASGSGAVMFDGAGYYARSSMVKFSDTVLCTGRWLDVMVMASQIGEIRIFFATTMTTDPRVTSVNGAFTGTGPNAMVQVQDYPPMFVPNDQTKWTIWRRIEVSGLFFLPVLFNLSGSSMSTYRMAFKVYDSQH